MTSLNDDVNLKFRSARERIVHVNDLKRKQK